MPTAHSIPPFPSDIDRCAFGHWLSGFTDGEGCFLLSIYKYPCNNYRRICQAQFRIALRDDDYAILDKIRSFLGCGYVERKQKNDGGGRKGKPACRYIVRGAAHLLAKVVAHFEKFPLRAKKRDDFLIWREGVILINEIIRRPLKGNVGGTGILPRWLDSDYDSFAFLASSLRNQRIYQESSTRSSSFVAQSNAPCQN